MVLGVLYAFTQPLDANWSLTFVIKCWNCTVVLILYCADLLIFALQSYFPIKNSLILKQIKKIYKPSSASDPTFYILLFAFLLHLWVVELRHNNWLMSTIQVTSLIIVCRIPQSYLYLYNSINAKETMLFLFMINKYNNK